MKILVLGTGYVGLVTATCFAEMGHHVVSLDIDKSKIETLQKGKVPFYEPELEELVKRNQKAQRLTFTTDYAKGLEQAKVCFIAVGTPPQKDGSADLSYLKEAISDIGKHLTHPCLVVIKSTVPVGTARQMQRHLQTVLEKEGKNIPVEIASNPEFLKEGSAVQDCMKPDRIIIGTTSALAAETLKKLYSAFTFNHNRILVMDPLSAEMTKYASNAMLATRISFMNELAGLCEKTGVNIDEVRKGMSADERIGYHFLYAGVGYGGSCFPKDIRALIATAEKEGHETPLLKAVHRVNEEQKELLAKKMVAYFEKQGGIEGKTIAIWGLSFKPNTDDVRAAPALTLIKSLIEKGVYLRLFDPMAMENAKKALLQSPLITFTESEYEAAKGAHAIALMTEWKQFRFADLDTIFSHMKGKAFFDGRNQYQARMMITKGFHYFGIGIPPLPEKQLKTLLQLSKKQRGSHENAASTSNTY